MRDNHRLNVEYKKNIITIWDWLKIKTNNVYSAFKPCYCNQYN